MTRNIITEKRAEYPNYSKPWYLRDNLELERCFDKKMTLADMCNQLGRNPNSLVRHMTTMGLLRKGSNGELLRFSHQTMEWRLWATVRNDKIITDGFQGREGEETASEHNSRLRSEFERNFILQNPQSSVKRAPHDPAKYLYAYTESLWQMTLGIFKQLGHA